MIVKDFGLDALADPPVEQCHARVDGLGDRFACIGDHAPDIGNEAVGTLDDLEVVFGTHRRNSFELVLTADERRCFLKSKKRL